MMGFADAFAQLFAPPKPTRYYKVVENGVLTMWGMGDGGEEITAEEYAVLQALLADKPTPPEGYDFRLTAALEWEQYELPSAPDPETLPVDDPMEALVLLLGGDGDE